MADKICPTCKTINRAESMYCTECGASLVNVAVIGQEPAPRQPVYTPSAPAYTPAALTASSGPARVIVTDINMSFGSMVVFMVKWSLAAVPAMIILFSLLAIVSTIFGGMFAALLGGLFSGFN